MCSSELGTEQNAATEQEATNQLLTIFLAEIKLGYFPREGGLLKFN